MPSLDQLDANSEFVRILYVGNSGAGKTGSLVSLVAAGYRIRMIDLDNGFGILKQYVLHECPDKIGNVSVVSFRDKYKADSMGVKPESATAYINTMKALDKWPDDESNPAEWGPETVLVIDSLTQLGDASFAWQRKLNPAVNDPRQIYKLAQDSILAFLRNLTADSFRTNVIVCSHIRYNETETRGFANSIGKAIGPVIPSYFNNFICAELKGAGDNAKRVIRTSTNGILDLKSEKPFSLDKELPLSTGLATLFAQLKGK